MTVSVTSVTLLERKIKLPSQNPKHNKKRAVYQRKQNYSSSSGPNIRLILMGSIFVAVIAVVVIVILNLDAFNPPGEDEIIFEDGDSANIHYKMWVDDDHDGIIEWVDIDPDYEDTFLATIDLNEIPPGLAPGFVHSLIGMEENETNRFYLEANVDEDQDGIDDDTGRDVVSFTGTHELSNTKLLFWLQILDIVKEGETYTGTLPQASPVTQIYVQTNLIGTGKYFLKSLA